MNKYKKLQEVQQKRFDSLPITFAFGDKQLTAALEKLGAKSADECFTFGYGSIMKKVDKQLLIDHQKLTNKEDAEAEKDDNYIHQMFYYELGNHEYSYTYEEEPTLEACGFTLKQVREDKRLNRIFSAAREQYLKDNVEEY